MYFQSAIEGEKMSSPQGFFELIADIIRSVPRELILLLNKLPYVQLDPDKDVRGVIVILMTAILATYGMTNLLLAPWLERKVMARMMGRRGPVYVGKFGLLQLIADIFKLISKEDTMPMTADKFGFNLAIFMMGITTVMSFAPIPWARGVVGGNMDVGLLYVFAVFSIFPPAMLLGGWASNSKYALVGGFRAAAQLVAYEIPMMLSVLGVIIYSGSFNLSKIVEEQYQNGWFVYRAFPGLFIAFGIFLFASLAETERTPFDIPEAEGELVMGPRTEFSGWRYAIILMVEYIHMYVNVILVIVLFLGGWDVIPVFHGVNYPQYLWMLKDNRLLQFIVFNIKIYIGVFFVTWVRVSFPRFRIDQFIEWGWKTLLPMAFLALIIVVGYAGLFAA